MNLDRSLLFSYIEEDNIQRAYFRVRPLLTPQGDIRAEAEQLWPNEGCLRIVPDRNEQHTFKVRMRTLGSFCVVDLRNQPVDAGKIRTNKNYRPERGEINQYILYSDTVFELPENSFYQIIDGAAQDYAAAAEKAVTPLFYLRSDDTLYGPVRKAVPQLPTPASEAAGTLFELPCPDGVTRMILCMEDAPVPAALPQTEQAPVQEVKPEEPKADVVEPDPAPAEDTPALPIGEKLQILDESKDFEETLKDISQPLSRDANLLKTESKAAEPLPESVAKSIPLTGTPLIRTPLRTATPQAKNRVQEVVSNQWSVGKYEPPAQPLPGGVAMRRVENPVETACTSLRQAWNATASQDQLLDLILSLDGIRAKLEPRLCQGSSETIMQRVLRDRLNDLEAERLTALCQLDKARRDVDAFKAELINEAAARLRRETSQLEQDCELSRKRVDELKSEINALAAQRDALAARVDELQGSTLPATAAKLFADAQLLMPVAGTPLRMTPVAGSKVAQEDLISAVKDACIKSGIEVDRNTAVALLVAFAVSPRLGLSCSTPAPLTTLVKNIISALGWNSAYAHQIAAEQKPVTAPRPVDGTPAVLMTSLPNYAPLNGVNKLLLSRNTANLCRNAAYDAHPWPIMMLPALPYVPEVSCSPSTSVSADAVSALLDNPGVTDEELNVVLSPVLKAAMPLSADARSEMFRFVSACAGLMEGGLPVAADWAIALWIIPAIDRGSKHYAAVKAQLDEYPLSLAKL